MDRLPQTSTPSKPTGIPRLSKLPLAKGRPSQIPAPPPPQPSETTKIATGSTNRPVLRNSASNSSFSSSTQPRNSASNPSFSSSTQPTFRKPSIPSKPIPSRTNLPDVSRNGAKSSTATRIGGVRPVSRVNQYQRVPSNAEPSVSSDDAETGARLNSFDGSRSASQQSFNGDLPLNPVEASNDREISRRKGSRPSLSDRTIESLQTLPLTPQDRRRPSFFNSAESPMGPPPRPSSRSSRTESNGSRPGTSDGTIPKAIGRAPSPAKKPSVDASLSSRKSASGSGFDSNNASVRSVSATSSRMAQSGKSTPAASPRSSTSFVKPAEVATIEIPTDSAVRKKTKALTHPKPRPISGENAELSEANRPATADTNAASSGSKRVASSPGNTSSAALRQQIAAAKAAARRGRTKHDSPQDSFGTIDGAYDDELHTDPFNQAPKDEKHMIRNRINTARMDGKLNIAAMSLKQFPEEVLGMYDASSLEEGKVSWSEVVDLTRLNAADNELEQLEDSLFPDRSVFELSTDDEGEGNQFGGLELLDLHGNILQALPMGLRRLERLTSLNLSHNRLENPVLDVISQIPSLRELKLGNNSLAGSLPSSICELTQLEVLDLQANRFLALPEAFCELASLKSLNVSGNQLTALPMEALQRLRLTDLDASNNMIIASLFPLGSVSGHPTLQNLNLANNSLAALTFSETLELPQLKTLNLTNNHLTALPPVTGWTELVTLAVGDNKVSDFPPGFTNLQKLRNVNFTSNEIRVLDPKIANMRNLDSLVLASNPLRDKKFLTMNAADIKQNLKARATPVEDEQGGWSENDDPTSPVTVIGAPHSASNKWSLGPNGVLDLTSKNLTDGINDSLGSFLKGNEVSQLRLSTNKITCVPPALWLGQHIRVLELSDNILSPDYLSDDLNLPSLQELNLSRCRLTSLEPLTNQLQAPNMKTLNISTNRITGPVPTLRAIYPRLSALFANDNKFTVLTAASLHGLQTVNLASNDIAQLPAEVGLLWDEGLRVLEIGSNAFRVPSFRVLEKGTEATLRWLRDKLPADYAQEQF